MFNKPFQMVSPFEHINDRRSSKRQERMDENQVMERLRRYNIFALSQSFLVSLWMIIQTAFLQSLWWSFLDPRLLGISF
jgi:hypothetical protein